MIWIVQERRLRDVAHITHIIWVVRSKTWNRFTWLLAVRFLTDEKKQALHTQGCHHQQQHHYHYLVPISAVI
jgi:hypothetical protein